MDNQKKWQVKNGNPIVEKIFQHELGISKILARLLVNRGIYTVDEVKLYLEDSPFLGHNPFGLKDMDKAVERIQKALAGKEKILIYGDYDADGITSTVLLMKLLKGLGGLVDYFIPHRLTQGYGLHLDVLKKIRDNGFSLIITVDCGISDAEVVEEAIKDGGLDIIITDHHKLPKRIPLATAVINPKRQDNLYPFQKLAGVGVAFKLAQALLGDEKMILEYLELVCVGTIADLVSLQGENRVLVKKGLNFLIEEKLSLGLDALFNVAGVNKENLKAKDIAFMIAPRLNAAGRVGDVDLAIELLLTEDGEKAKDLAQQLNKINQMRQKIESFVLSEALGILDAEPLLTSSVIVLGVNGWHFGVIGIVASRLVERYNRPVILVALEEDGTGKGSGRSVLGFNMYEALVYCQDCFDHFGGHDQAGGFTLKKDKLAYLREKINNYAKEFMVNYEPQLNLDAWVSLENISVPLIEELKALAPLGEGNEEPLLGCKKVELLSFKAVGRDKKHLKLLLKKNKITLGGIAFGLGELEEELKEIKYVDIAFLPILNEWNEQINVELNIFNLRPFIDEKEHPIHSMSYEKAKQSLQSLGNKAFIPSSILERIEELSKDNHLLDNKINNEINVIEIENIISSSGFPLFSLKNLIKEGGKNLIIVSTPIKTIELFFYLQNEGIATNFLHQGMKAENINDFLDNKEVIISTSPSLSYLKDIDFEKVIFYEPPFLREQLVLPSKAKVYTCFKEKEMLNFLVRLENLFLRREDLLKIYSYLRQKFKEGSWEINFEEILILCSKIGLKKDAEISFKWVLDIFSQLDLLEYHYFPLQGKKGGIYKGKLFPIKQKRDLQESSIYSWLQNLKRETLNLWNEMGYDFDI